MIAKQEYKGGRGEGRVLLTCLHYSKVLAPTNSVELVISGHSHDVHRLQTGGKALKPSAFDLNGQQYNV